MVLGSCSQGITGTINSPEENSFFLAHNFLFAPSLHSSQDGVEEAAAATNTSARTELPQRHWQARGPLGWGYARIGRGWFKFD
jgi:hypothetical protein